jgi:putative transposase
MTLLPLIRCLVDERPTYGYQRITALVNPELARAAHPPVNHKRVFRIMRQNGVLLSKHTGCRTSRVHAGKVVVMRSNCVVTLTDIGRIETNSAA